ncbi:MAG: glycosyl transferase group 1 [Chloroflexi bacterium]|nr:glycosyl transferase group 1 [Chloroflexota bacterium]
MSSELSVAFLGSYPPRACGIATFTRDLCKAVLQCGRGVSAKVAAINDEGALYRYPSLVHWTIDQHDASSWRDAARAINASNVNVVSIQHEFGIYGHFSRDGRLTDYLPCFLDELRKPVVTTLHTVVPHPSPDISDPVRTLHDKSAAVVTMVNMAGLILEQEYGLDHDKLHMIPHGVPMVPRVPLDKAKRAVQLDGRTVLMTFGLLSSSKGIQHVIRGLPDVVKRHPAVLYLVIGETHPETRRRDGEKYRNSLIELVKRLGLERHVRFVNQYLSLDQLIKFLQATDVYLTPYVDRNQITSGTLAYALGCGKPVISTPYLYAAEALAEGRGLLAEFENPRSLARCIRLLLEEPALREHCENSALAYGRPMGWDSVARSYSDLFYAAAGIAERRPSITACKQPLLTVEEVAPGNLLTATHR